MRPIRNPAKRAMGRYLATLITAVATIALALSSGAGVAADEDDASARVVAELGLRQAPDPVRERAGWRKPKRVVVRADAARVAWLQQVAPDVELVPAPTIDAALALIGEADAVIGFCSEQLLGAAPELRWIQLPYAGAERCLQVPAITERQILVTNAQRVYGPEIAEHVMAMLLNFSRGLYWYRTAQIEGKWEPGLVPEDRLWELDGKTMLIVGLGGIGTEVARRANALGMVVIATRNSSREGPDFVSYVGLADELLDLTARADVVVNAAPLTAATTGLFDASVFPRDEARSLFHQRWSRPQRRHQRSDHSPGAGFDRGRCSRRNRSRAVASGSPVMDSPGRDHHTSCGGTFRSARRAPVDRDAGEPSPLCDRRTDVVSGQCGARLLGPENRPWQPDRSFRVAGALVQLGDLGPFQRQVIHQTLVSEHEADDGVLDVVGVDRTTGTQFDQRHGAIDAGFPARSCRGTCPVLPVA